MEFLFQGRLTLDFFLRRPVIRIKAKTYIRLTYCSKSLRTHNMLVAEAVVEVLYAAKTFFA